MHIDLKPEADRQAAFPRCHSPLTTVVVHGHEQCWCANPILLNAVPAKFVSRLRLLLNPFHKNEVSFRSFFTDQFGSCVAI